MREFGPAEESYAESLTLQFRAKLLFSNWGGVFQV